MLLYLKVIILCKTGKVPNICANWQLGKYAISANCKGYQNQTKQIEIDVDATTEVSISLQPETAYNNTSSRTGKSLVGMVLWKAVLSRWGQMMEKVMKNRYTA